MGTILYIQVLIYCLIFRVFFFCFRILGYYMMILLLFRRQSSFLVPLFLEMFWISVVLYFIQLSPIDDLRHYGYLYFVERLFGVQRVSLAFCNGSTWVVFCLCSFHLKSEVGYIQSPRRGAFFTAKDNERLTLSEVSVTTSAACVLVWVCSSRCYIDMNCKCVFNDAANY